MSSHLRVAVGIDEVGVIREPADPKDDEYEQYHFDNL
jgi:hypothetical protein